MKKIVQMVIVALCFLSWGCTPSSNEPRLIKFISGESEFNYEYRVYWVGKEELAIVSSNGDRPEPIRIINCRTEKLYKFGLEDNDNNNHFLRMLEADPESGLFIYRDWLEIDIHNLIFTDFLYDVKKNIITNLETDKAKILADPKKYFRDFRYYYQGEEEPVGTTYLYKLYRTNTYNFTKELLFSVNSKEWLKADNSEWATIRDYDPIQKLILYKYGGDRIEISGDYYLGTFDGKNKPELKPINYSGDGDARILNENNIMTFGDMNSSELYNLVIISLKGQIQHTIGGVEVYNNMDNISVNHETGQVAVIGRNFEKDEEGLYIYDLSAIKKRCSY